jgi:hypothetical protein
MIRIFPRDKFDVGNFSIDRYPARFRFYGRSISRGYLTPDSITYSPKSSGIYFPYEVIIVAINFKTTDPKNKTITIRTNETGDLFTFDTNENKALETYIQVPADNTLNVFMNGEGITGSFSLTIDTKPDWHW